MGRQKQVKGQGGIRSSQHPAELNGVAWLGEHAKTASWGAYKHPAEMDQGSWSTSWSSQLRFRSGAELPMVEPVVPVPNAGTFRSQNKQQRSLLEMVSRLPVFKDSAFALGRACCSLSSPNLWGQLILGQGILEDMLRQT